MMKKTFFLTTLILISLIDVFSQSPERPKKEIPLVSEVVSTLENASGWTLQNNGEWQSAQNKIPFRESDFNKNNRGRYSLGRENFNVIEIRQVTIKEVVYSIMIIKFNDGKYDFPMLEQNWQGFNNLKYYTFKEDRWNKVLPDSLVFNKPYAVNMQLLTSGTIEEYDEKTYLFEIENTVQKAIYLQEESGTNLIFAVYPVEINGEKFIRFKFYETINKMEIYVKFLLEYNWLKLFRNSYYEIDFSDFANFIFNVGAINPSKLNNSEYFRLFLENGIKKYNEEKFVTALQLFTKAFSVNPPDSNLITINLWKGKSKLQLRMFDEAVADFTKSINLSPITKTAKKDWTECYYQRGNAFNALHEFSKACDDWQKAMELGFEDAIKPIKKNCGKSLESGNLTINIKKASKSFNKAMKKYLQEEFLKAQFLFEESWLYNPVNNNFKLPYYIGMCRYNLGDYVRAVDDFDKAYKIMPDTADVEFESWLDVLIWRGKSLQECGYLNQACDDWLEAKKLNSPFADDFLEIYCTNYQPSKKSINQNPSDILDLGIKKYELGDFNSAIQIFNQAFENEAINTNFVLYAYRGTAKHKVKDYAGAVEDFTKAINLKPSSSENQKKWSESFYNRGVSKFYLKDLKGACSDWNEAGKLGIGEAMILINSYCDDYNFLDEDKSSISPENAPDSEKSEEQIQSPENERKPGNADDKKQLSKFISEIDAINSSFPGSSTSPEKISQNSTSKPVTFANQADNMFYVIIGTFKIVADAEKLAKDVKSKGYNPQVIHNTEWEIYFVSLYSSINEEDAASKLQEIQKDFPNANLSN